MKKKISWWVIVTGAIVGLSAVLLTHFGNPANMGFCIACFLRDIAGSLGLHSAGKVQYVRPEIIGLVLGAFVMSVCTKEFRAKSGSAPALRFVLGAFVMIGALAFLGCPLRMVLRLAGGDANALVGLVGFGAGIFAGTLFLKKGFSLKRSYDSVPLEGVVLPVSMTVILLLFLTDSLNTGTRFANATRYRLEAPGRFPALVRRGAVEVTLRLDGESTPELHAVGMDGKRRFSLPVLQNRDGELAFRLDTHAGEKAVAAWELCR